LFSICTASLFLITPPPPATYTLSLHDALPISELVVADPEGQLGDLAGPGLDLDPVELPGADLVDDELGLAGEVGDGAQDLGLDEDRKSTRLNSSHVKISYAVFCLKKKKNRKSK